MKTMRELRQHLMHYTDGTPSREVEDWEASGSEEMNRLHEECKTKINSGSALLKTRDHLTSIVDLVTVCREALANSKYVDINDVVGDVLHFHVIEQLKLLDEELSQLWNQLK